MASLMTDTGRSHGLYLPSVKRIPTQGPAGPPSKRLFRIPKVQPPSGGARTTPLKLQCWSEWPGNLVKSPNPGVCRGAWETECLTSSRLHGVGFGVGQE